MKRAVLVGMIVLVSTAGFCMADTDKLARENVELKKRVTRLENELEELKKIVYRQAAAAKVQPPAKAQPTQATAYRPTEAEMQKILALVEKQNAKKPVWSNLDIQLYGYLKADASYDTSRVTTGNFVEWVDSEATNSNDNEFNMTSNQTRLGMKITGPEKDGLKTSGLVEVDFYGNANAENKAQMMMRHAYLKLDWPEEHFSIIAGQTSDVFSPLNPSTLNYSVLWWTGNIGYRRPQIRLTKSFAIGSDTDLTLEGAIARPIGDNDLVTKSGEDSGQPNLQGRASLTFPMLAYKPTTVGVSGHWGREEDDSNSVVGTEKYDTWSLNIDLTQPVNKWLTIKGEFFTGSNLDAFLGGIGQGVNATTREEIASKGGWVAASLGPWDKWNFNVGAGMDDVDEGDVNTGNRTMNRSIFGNAIYSVNKNVQIGFELSHWRTEYKGAGDADDLRAQTSFIYKF